MNPRRSTSFAVLAPLLLALLPTPGCQPRDPLERARLLQDTSGDFAGSLEPLRALAEERPEDPEVNFRYGLALIASGQSSLAKWSLRKAMESPDWRVRAGIALAETSQSLGSYDEAIEVCDRVLEAEPDDAQALLLRANARVRSRRHYDLALADAERVLELDPDNADAMVPKVVALLGLGRSDEASEALDTLETAHRDTSLGLHGSPTLCAAQATFAKEKGELERAEELFDKCLETFPADGQVVREAVSLFDGLRRPERSEEILQAALAKEPDAFDYRAALVDRMRATGRDDEAEALLRAATELESPASAAVGWSALALFKLETGSYDDAAAAFERARALDPTGSPEIVFGYADALVVAGRYEEALRVADGMSVPAYQSLLRGRVALARGEPARALEHFTEGNRLWPNNAVSRYYAAAAAEQVGDFERAIEDYRYAMRIDVRATDAYLRLARLHAAAGRVDAALSALSFEPGGRPEEEAAAVLELELLARAGRPPPPTVLAQIPPTRRASAAAALARGFGERLGPEASVKFLRAQDDLDLRDPANSDALAALVDALDATGKAKEGLARVDAALAVHPDAAVLHALRARALAATGGDPASVRAAYERALALDAEEARALAGLARIDAEGGAQESALALYERAAKADASDRSSVRAAAGLLADLGRSEEAESRLVALLRDYPYDAEAAVALAELRLARGADRDATRELARRAVAFGGGDPAQALLERVDAAESAAGAPPAEKS